MAMLVYRAVRAGFLLIGFAFFAVKVDTWYAWGLLAVAVVVLPFVLGWYYQAMVDEREAARRAAVPPRRIRVRVEPGDDCQVVSYGDNVDGMRVDLRMSDGRHFVGAFPPAEVDAADHALNELIDLMNGAEPYRLDVNTWMDQRLGRRPFLVAPPA